MLGVLAAEGQDELRPGVPDVLDVVNRAGFHVVHLSGADDERGEAVGVAERGDQYGAGNAVGELISVDVPLRFADGAGFQDDVLHGQAAEYGQRSGVELGHRPQLALKSWLDGRK
jgi:hypothetical protein